VNDSKSTMHEPILEIIYSSIHSQNAIQRARRVLEVGKFLLAKDLSVLMT